MRNLLIIWKISTEFFFGNRKKKFHEFFFFFSNFFRLQRFSKSDIFSNQIFFRKYFFDFFLLFRAGGERSEQREGVGERSERRGVVGERSEPPAGGLAVGAEGSVNSEYF